MLSKTILLSVKWRNNNDVFSQENFVKLMVLVYGALNN